MDRMQPNPGSQHRELRGPGSEAFPLGALEYPSIPRRILEHINGSPRLSAMKLIRSAPMSGWEYAATPEPTVMATLASEQILFQFDSAEKLRAVHLATSHGEVAMAGDCELAARLRGYAARAVTLLHGRLKSQALKDLQTGAELNSNNAVDFKTSATNSHSPPDGFERLTVAAGLIRLPYGTVKVERRVLEYRYPSPYYQEQIAREMADYAERMCQIDRLSSMRAHTMAGSYPAHAVEIEIERLAHPRVASPAGIVVMPTSSFENENLKAIGTALGAKFNNELALGPGAVRGLLERIEAAVATQRRRPSVD